MWYLWEGSNGKFSVVCEIQEMDPWKMRERKEGDSEVGERCCVWKMQETRGRVEEWCEEVKTVKGFCYLRNRVNESGGCEAAVTARPRIG